jgi:hypothetical protein
MIFRPSRLGLPFLCGLFLFVSLNARAENTSPAPVPAGALDEKLFKGMQWRQVGPFRGGRALAIEGIAGEPDTYYFGGVAGGVWSYGWRSELDAAVRQGSDFIHGATAVAPSDHNVVYAAPAKPPSSNTTYGIGVYKSSTRDTPGKTSAERHSSDRSAHCSPAESRRRPGGGARPRFGPNQERGIFGRLMAADVDQGPEQR